MFHAVYCAAMYLKKAVGRLDGRLLGRDIGDDPADAAFRLIVFTSQQTTILYIFSC